MNPPEFDAGAPQAPEPQDAYPGPYGIGIGSVINDYNFMGYPRASPPGSKLQLIQLADFYNPSGMETFAPGSPYGEGRKPKALALIGGAKWCTPSNVQASTELPSRHSGLAPLGQFLFLLEDGSQHGTPATQAELDDWATRYHVDYPLAIDPRYTLKALTDVEAWPAYLIIRTRDMKIIRSVVGVPQDSFWQVFQDVIDDKPVLPGE
jgi:hypothetical protein